MRTQACYHSPETDHANLKPDTRLILVINGTQLWTNHGGAEREVLCPTEHWAEDLAKITHAWVATGLGIETTLTRLGFKPCQA